MANRFFREVNKDASDKQSGKAGLDGNPRQGPTPDSTPDGTANWPTHGGTSGPMGGGTPKVKQSAKTTL